MSEALVPAVATPESDAADATAVPTSGVARAGSTAIALPRMIVDAGPVAAERFLEFFAGRIANERTRAAYARAAGQFLGWCEGRGLSLKAIAPLHVAAYIRTHPGSAPTVKQHLAAIRMLCDWLVVSQVPAGEPGRGRARSPPSQPIRAGRFGDGSIIRGLMPKTLTPSGLTAVLRVQVTPEMKQLLETEAAARYESLSEVARQAIEIGLRKLRKDRPAVQLGTVW